MNGIGEIRRMNSNPKRYAKSQLSDGQERREASGGKAFWSETPKRNCAENMATMQVAPQSVAKAIELQFGKQPIPLPEQYFTAVKLYDHHNGHANALATGLRLARIAETEEQMREAADFLDGVFKRIEISRQSAT